MNLLNEMEKVETAIAPSFRDDGRQAFTLLQAWGLFTLVSGAMLGLLAWMPASVLQQAVFLFFPGLALLLLAASPL